MLLTGLSVALSLELCVGRGRFQKCREKTFETEFININQNLGVIL